MKLDSSIRAENGSPEYEWDGLERGVMPKPPRIPGSTMHTDGWRPSFNPGLVDDEGNVSWKARSRQEMIFETEAMYILAYGERASGKTYGALHALVRHCYENDDALAIIIVGVKRQAEEGGAWHKLLTMILPEWEEGLGYDRNENPFFTEPKTNTAKDVYLWVRTANGGWSRVLMLSMPVGSFVADRVKGMEPSFVLVDEAQTLSTDTYFKHLVQQIGRRPGIEVQQIIYCCNPAGPSHWLYKRFFEMSGLLDDNLDPDYAIFHVPVQENRHNLSDRYWRNLMQAVKGDEIEEARMLRGEWIDKPSGNSIFAGKWDRTIHVIGDKIRGITPVPGYPIIVGYDPGPVNFSIHMMQKIHTASRIVWSVFDEMNYVGELEKYSVIIPKLCRRMDFWGDFVGFPFEFVHICDEAAWSQRDREQSFDAFEIERLSRQVPVELALQGAGAGTERIRLQSAPKGADSVPARVNLMIQLLQAKCIVVSGRCTKTIAMFEHLLSQKETEKKAEKYDPLASLRPRRSVHIHPFDSLSYPIWKDHCEPGTMSPRQSQPLSLPEADPPRAFSCGQR